MPGLPAGSPMGLLGFPAKANIVSAEKCHACTASDISYIRPLGSSGWVSYIWQPYVKLKDCNRKPPTTKYTTNHYTVNTLCHCTVNIRRQYSAWNRGNQWVHYSASAVISMNCCNCGVKCVLSTASYCWQSFLTYLRTHLQLTPSHIVYHQSLNIILSTNQNIK